jgi:hypothetical protein
MYSDIVIREIFHFFFLEKLLSVSDAKLFILKGGVNLRFFFNSPRYSEDMDIDIVAGAVGTLKKNVYKILEDKNFRRKLFSYGIQDLLINDPNNAKQTDTTQRFKLSIVNNNGDKLVTKIEFSRREIKQNFLLERINTEIARNYSSLAFLVNHYDGLSAIEQKIYALAGRKQVEVRDVFDIFILDLGGYSKNFPRTKISKEILSQAEEALLSISYEDYSTKVLEFLSLEDRDKFEGKESWSEIQTRVLEIISKWT